MEGTRDLGSVCRAEIVELHEQGPVSGLKLWKQLVPLFEPSLLLIARRIGAFQRSCNQRIKGQSSPRRTDQPLW